MAQDSRRVRRIRRIKRQRSQLRQAVGRQQQQLQTVVGMLMEAQKQVRELTPTPSVTIRTIAEPTCDICERPLGDATTECSFCATQFAQPAEETHDNARPYPDLT